MWGYSGDIRSLVQEERRRGRFNDRDWLLSMNRHGSKPALEPLRTHLEWHAMWCASGEFLKTEPLALYDEDDWNDLSVRIHREKLVEPPLWSADRLVSTPLLARNWRPKKRPLDEWVAEVREAYHRAEIFPCDRQAYVVVDGSSERRSGDRIERVGVSSALVEPATSRSLVRALQTMGDSWDYKLPEKEKSALRSTRHHTVFSDGCRARIETRVSTGRILSDDTPSKSAVAQGNALRLPVI